MRAKRVQFAEETCPDLLRRAGNGRSDCPNSRGFDGSMRNGTASWRGPK